MTFPIPPQIWAKRPFTSIWTDFTNAYDGETLIGSYPVGVPLADWTGSGGSYSNTVTALAGTISGQAVYLIGTAATGNTGFVTWNAIPAVADVEVLQGIMVDLVWASPAARCAGSILRCTDANNFAMITLLDGANHDNVDFFIANAGTVESNTPLFSWSIGVWYWVRSQVTGDLYRIKIWPRSEPEPPAWTATYTTAHQPGPGLVGIASSSRYASRIACDFFSVSTDGTPAYGPGL